VSRYNALSARNLLTVEACDFERSLLSSDVGALPMFI
jgi:hypothetical protein